MHNEYDNEKFFQEYAKMPRSAEGLGAAGEWHQLKPLFPPLQGKHVLDLGCGYGWHCRFSAENGAEQVLGIDLPDEMIEQVINGVKAKISIDSIAQVSGMFKNILKKDEE